MKVPLRQGCHAYAKFVYQFFKRHAKHATMKKAIFTACFSFCVCLFAKVDLVWARPPTEADFLAGSITAEEIGLFFENLEKKPANVAIFDVRINAPLDPSFAEPLEGETVRVLRDTKSITVMNCFECRAPKLEVREDKLVVKKGMPDQAALTQLGKQLGVDSFLMIEVFRTRFSLTTQVTLLQASDGTVIGSRLIKVPALDWSDAGLQVLIGLGPSLVGGGNEPVEDGGYSLGGHFSLLEEIGFGKAGLVVGGAGGPRGGFGYATPTVAWRGRWGSYGIYSLKSIGAGFGISDGVGGLALRLDYTIMLGSFTMVGVDLAGLVPLGSVGPHHPVSSAATIYIGFSLGR